MNLHLVRGFPTEGNISISWLVIKNPSFVVYLVSLIVSPLYANDVPILKTAEAIEHREGNWSKRRLLLDVGATADDRAAGWKFPRRLRKKG